MDNKRSQNYTLDTSAFNTLCLCRVKEDGQQQKEERNREEDRQEEGN